MVLESFHHTGHLCSDERRSLALSDAQVSACWPGNHDRGNTDHVETGDHPHPSDPCLREMRVYALERRLRRNAAMRADEVSLHRTFPSPTDAIHVGHCKG